MSDSVQRKKDWQTGYLLAVSTMLHQHGRTVTAEDCIRDSGITLTEAKACKLDPFDTKVLWPVFREMKRRDKYRYQEPNQ
jgi:hypothetical protein